MLDGKRIIVVPPAHNAESTLVKTYDEIPPECLGGVALVDDGSHDRMNRYLPVLALSALLLLVTAELLLLESRADRIPLLADRADSHWIVVDEPVNLAAQRCGERHAGFQLSLQTPQPQDSLRLRVEAFRSATVLLNGDSVATTPVTGAAIARTEVELAPHLKPGVNQLLVVVTNDRGPPAVRVEADLRDVGSGSRWLASTDGKVWRAARVAASHRYCDIAEAFPSPWQSVLKGWPILLAGAVLGALTFWAGPRLARRRSPAELLRLVRWLLIGSLGAIFAFNFNRVPDHIGMDLDSHLAYVEYILDRGALPLANEGWQLFQPPLAYLVAAGATLLAKAMGFTLGPAVPARGLTMAVTLLAVWLGGRTVERIFSDRPALAALGMVMVASLPAAIYMAHAFGNEPYFACLGAWLLYLLAEPPGDKWPWRRASVLGAVAGLAMLAKTSALILVAAAASLLWQRIRQQRGAAVARRSLALYFGVLTAVAGWWYLRNQIELGRPVVGGWEVGRGLDWWQYPGYRKWEHLLGFGGVLARPIFAGAMGLWDGIYSSLWGDGYLSSAIVRSYAPNWNYDVMLGLYLLALPLTLAIVAGTVRALATTSLTLRGTLLRLAAVLLVLYLGAAFHIYASVPIYSAAKGSYLLVLAPCLAALAAWGVEPLLRHRAGQLSVAVVLGVWVSFAALAFVAQAAP